MTVIIWLFTCVSQFASEYTFNENEQSLRKIPGCHL